MTTRFDAIDLSKATTPAFVEVIDYDQGVADRLQKLQYLLPSFNVPMLESDPTVKNQETCHWREILLRQRINDVGLAVTLAFATGTDLDAIGERYDLTRKVITPGDPTANPPTVDVLEGDETYRAAIQLSVEAWSSCGPKGAYVYYASRADINRIKDVAVAKRQTGRGDVFVDVVVLSNEGDGTADSDLIDTVITALDQDDRLPLTDAIAVRSADIIHYTVDAVIRVPRGPDSSLVHTSAVAEVQDMVDSFNLVGNLVPTDALIAALRVPNVRKAILNSPTEDIDPGPYGAAKCTSITITVEVIS